MEMEEAVALFDYNGRTNKELSFKTNQIIYIYKKLNHQWWLGHIAGKYQSGFIPDGYIKLKSKRRDSAPVQHLPSLSIASNPSSSLHSVNLPTSSNDKLDISISNFSLADEHHHHPIYDVLPPSPPQLISTNGHDHSSSSHLTSPEVLSEECHAQQETDAPDLVLNLPISNGFLTSSSSKSLDENIPIIHSTIIIDLERKTIPPPIMKKPEKTIQLIKRLGLQQQPISISRSAKATEV